MKTKVKMTNNSQDYAKGDVGYIDGYIRNKEGFPFAVVIIEGNFVLAPL